MDKRTFKTALLSLTLAATGSAFAAGQDGHFLQMMSSHHKDGIKMAEIAQEKASDPAVKELAAKLANEQKKEISQMQSWQKQWYANEKTVHETQPMYMRPLEHATGKQFDRMFLELMTEHHREAISMTQSMQSDLDRKEIREFASKSTKKQEDEVKNMQQLKSKL